MCTAVARSDWLGFVLFLLLCLFVFIQNSHADDMEWDYVTVFSKYPNRMIEWDQELPETRLLLKRYKPIIYIAPDSYTPMSFYRDYLPNCKVRSVKTKGGIQSVKPDRQLLRRIQFDKDKYLDYQLTPEQALVLSPDHLRPTVYGRVYTDKLMNDDQSFSFIFLTIIPNIF